MTTFNRFPDLPTELRVQIWKLVIRDDRPGVHIFSHCDSTKKSLSEMRVMVSREWCGSTFCELSPLHYFDSVRKDVPRKNVSTYLIDGGMWTACKESRSIMENHFRQSDWNDILPRRDLFVLQIDSVDDIDWRKIGSDSSFGASTLGGRGIYHIGIELNPEWWDSKEGEWDYSVLRTLTRAALDSDPLSAIWIIDHGHKRRKDAPAFEAIYNDKSHLEAFSASDRKLLEVDPQHPEHWTDSHTRLPPDAWNPNSSSLDFARCIRDEIEDERLSDYDKLFGYHYSCHVGILGWDDL
ncbi:hypothetical protein FSPOR_5881 [Fusarium sporotrichioides]|uniref:2EXR domain-containing protein n=1 Tax=Fusarium sporotrichioides TaxID=5514 RepID=A0A395S5P5_FUSSP|nr:hypothetical protein FSPOR_5881 [Fusarium sporotrichioides]